MELKTLKDLKGWAIDGTDAKKYNVVEIGLLKAEAVKWVKKLIRKEPHSDAILEFQIFFNLTEEDLE